MSAQNPAPGPEPTRSEPLELRVEALEARVRELSAPRAAASGIALMLHDSRLELVLAGMSLASGAAALGEPARVFFAFGAIAALLRPCTQSMEQQLRMARELGVKIYVCENSMRLLGFGMHDLVDYPGLEACAVATFLCHALASRVSLAL